MTNQANVPFVFISYSHMDSPQVMPLIDQLKAYGYAVWFDSGIEAGTEWPLYIGQQIQNCACMIAFMSQNAHDSDYCRREISMAISLKKPLLVAVLEPVTMDAGMQFLLGTLQHIYRSKFDDSSSFVNALCQSRLLEESLGKTQAAAAIPMQTKDTRYHYPDGSVYTGSMKDGVPHGFGVRKWPNEEALERPLWAGESEEDYLRLLDPDIGGWSMMYEGEFDHSYAHGYGTLSWNNGTSYTGGFFRDLYHGHGSYSDTPFYWKGEYDHGDLISGSGYIRLGLEEWYRGELVSSETATPFSRQRVMPQGNGVLIREHNGHATERPVSFPAKKR